MDKRLKLIANHYKYPAQSQLLVEEMSRLIMAIEKLYRFKHGTAYDIFYDEGEGFFDKQEKLIYDISRNIARVDMLLQEMRHILKIDDKFIASVQEELIHLQLAEINNSSTEERNLEL